MLSLSISCLVLLICRENVNASFQNNEDMKLASSKLTTFSLAEDCRLEKCLVLVCKMQLTITPLSIFSQHFPFMSGSLSAPPSHFEQVPYLYILELIIAKLNSPLQLKW